MNEDAQSWTSPSSGVEAVNLADGRYEPEQLPTHSVPAWWFFRRQRKAAAEQCHNTTWHGEPSRQRLAACRSRRHVHLFGYANGEALRLIR